MTVPGCEQVLLESRVPPSRIALLEQSPPSRAAPVLDLLLPRESVLDPVKHLQVDQQLALVRGSEPGYRVIPMFPKSSLDIACNAGVQDGETPIGQDVYITTTLSH